MIIAPFLKSTFFRRASAGILLAVLSVLSSCNSEQKAKTSDTASVKNDDTVIVDGSSLATPAAPLKSDSSALVKGIISELDRMNQAFVKHDVAQITSFFDFPIHDTALVFFEINPEFDAQYKANGNKVSRAMFSKHYSRIEEFHSMTEFIPLFKYLKPEGLLKSNMVEHEHRVKNDGCYYFYSIRRQGATVILTYGTNTSSAYVNPDPEEGEVCGEYAGTWFFEFRDGKLHFVKQMTAG
ncbi:hypothetical protein [Pedobacter sp. BAL39]|uniref:hypothetical protein n=1 Tax=Pedobacter sp. BAL39 TaxID=391596 RepID=UPI0012F89475|nr:hypothetical protein [Pedobacter sp. BAL39]